MVSAGDSETFAQNISERIAGPQGNLVYSEIALAVNCCKAKEQAPNLSWSRVKEASPRSMNFTAAPIMS